MVHCYHVYDETLDLVALTATGATGQQWTVLDLDELAKVADLVSAAGWPRDEGPLELDDVRRVVILVTGRDPDR